MWLLVAVALAGEPECAGRLYEGTLLEVGEALGIPGATLTAENARKREHLSLCTDPTLTGTALNAWHISALLLGYCVVQRPDADRFEWDCRQVNRRTVTVTLDEAGLERRRELMAAVPRRTTEDGRGVVLWRVVGLELPNRTRFATVTWLTPDPPTSPGIPTCTVDRGLRKRTGVCDAPPGG